MKLRARIFLLVALAVAPTSTLLIFDSYQRLQVREAEAEQEALRSARLVSAELDQIFKGIESLLRTAAQTSMISAFQNPECTDYLRRLESINSNAGRIVAVDATGLVRCGATAGITNIADRGYFRAALKSDDLLVGSYTIGRDSGAPILPLAIQFTSSEGSGVLVAGLRLDWLAEHFSKVFAAFPPRSSLTIVDRDGIMLVRLPNAERAGNPLQNYEYVVHAPEPGVFRSTAEKNADGIARYLGFTPIESPPRGVAIAVGFPQASVLAEAFCKRTAQRPVDRCGGRVRFRCCGFFWTGLHSAASERVARHYRAMATWRSKRARAPCIRPLGVLSIGTGVQLNGGRTGNCPEA